MKKTLIFSLLSALLLFSCKTSRMPLPHIEGIDLLKIVISGDFMQHTPQIDSARVAIDSFDYDTPLRRIKHLWQSADFAVINLETTLSNNPKLYSGYPMFCAPAASLRALARAGISGVALANNHIFDKRLRGVQQTLTQIEASNLSYAGIGFDSVRIMVMERGKFKVTLLNYSYGTNGMPTPPGVKMGVLDSVVIAHDIVKARALGATHIIVFYHWGDEYRTYPNAAQRELALWSRACGADIVVGSHPHVVQPIDAVNKIVYSLGNFVSNQSSPNTETGISVRLTFCSGVGEPNIEFLSHRVDRSDKYTILPVKSSVIDKIVQKIVKYE